MDLIPDCFQENHTSDMGPIEEYVKIHRELFGSMEDARMGAVIACSAGEKGGRISLLMAVMTTSRTSTSEPEVRQFLRPVALRACGGHSLYGQLFLRQSRFNMKLTKEQVHKIPGLFHVTTEIAWIQILQDGLKAGIDLPRARNGEGRADIHMLVVPPYPNDHFQNKRLDKMWNKGYGTVVVIIIRKEALDLDDARINQQGVVL